MSERAPIPPAEFAAAVDRLDRAALAGFVARLEAAADDSDVTVDADADPPIVERGDGSDRRRVAVVSDDGRESPAGDDLDAVVVTADPSEIDGTSADVDVLTPADLRQQLLYALAPDAAEAVAEEWLGVPARAASYASTTVGTDADDGADRPTEATASDPDAGTDPPTSVERSTREDADGSASTETAGGAGSPDRTTARSDSESTAAGGWSVGQAAVVAALLVILLGGAGGVVYAAELSPDGDAGAFTAAEPGTEELSEADLRRRSRGSLDGNDTATTPVAGGGGIPAATDGAEGNRNVRPVPTCTRSPLLVVQIQMNALRYNNDTTNDGIRTVRRFASPGNREAIDTFEAFVQTIKSPTYSPMLSYDSVEYTPIRVDDDFAQIQVVTRENGSVTGQYYFRQRKVDDGRYEGCWMTDGVVTAPQTGVVDGDVSHPEGRPTADQS